MPLTWSAILYFTESPGMVETMTHLGYPPYFLKILGTAKLLGVAALLFDRLKLLKEWAYAGFTFDLLGAAWFHLASGDPFYVALVPIGFLVVMVISYVSWKRLQHASVTNTAAKNKRGRPKERPHPFSVQFRACYFLRREVARN